MTVRAYRPYTVKNLDEILARARLPRDRVADIRAVAAVLPFRVNNYVVDELIDWDDVPRDPIFQLTFPQPGMLSPTDLATMRGLIHGGAPREAISAAARGIQGDLNPHPSGQMDLNVPRAEDGTAIPGMQHKYRETVLFFPAQGQTCHAYCSYCFRWAQFVGDADLRFANREAEALARYVADHREVTDVLITGGDPMIMRTAKLRAILEPLLAPELEHLRSIRIGSKALAWWPYRFVSEDDADDLMRLFEQVTAAGKQLAFMAHSSHPRELEPQVARDALRRIRATGAMVRCQAPLIRHVNDDAATWAELWRAQVQQGAVPYYMFVERDTGARRYFEVPLVRAQRIFADAYRQVSGLARTVRGPSMSASPGKVVVQGEARIHGERVLALQLIQARDPSWVGRPFFAQYSPQATWLDDLQPAFGEQRFFFETADRRARAHRVAATSRNGHTRAKA